MAGVSAGVSRACVHGGYYSQNRSHGPFYVGYSYASGSYSGIGCRLQERPPKAA